MTGHDVNRSLVEFLCGLRQLAEVALESVGIADAEAYGEDPRLKVDPNSLLEDGAAKAAAAVADAYLLPLVAHIAYALVAAANSELSRVVEGSNQSDLAGYRAKYKSAVTELGWLVDARTSLAEGSARDAILLLEREQQAALGLTGTAIVKPGERSNEYWHDRAARLGLLLARLRATGS